MVSLTVVYFSFFFNTCSGESLLTALRLLTSLSLRCFILRWIILSVAVDHAEAAEEFFSAFRFVIWLDKFFNFFSGMILCVSRPRSPCIVHYRRAATFHLLHGPCHRSLLYLSRVVAIQLGVGWASFVKVPPSGSFWIGITNSIGWVVALCITPFLSYRLGFFVFKTWKRHSPAFIIEFYICLTFSCLCFYLPYRAYTVSHSFL